MKKVKKVLMGCAVVTVVAVAAMNVTSSKAKTGMLSDLYLANIEALASGENPNGGGWSECCAGSSCTPVYDGRTGAWLGCCRTIEFPNNSCCYG